LVTYVGVQLKIEPDEIQKYALHQQTISEHQIRIRQYLNLDTSFSVSNVKHAVWLVIINQYERIKAMV
jgi:hypothetical protein